ncbi:MAG: preprotein translocase subunit YajC [Desulfobulbus sp.]|jgi:preprotein translocase subunit YajC
MSGIAWAAAPATPAAGGGASALVQFVPLILIFVIFYFLLIRPQQKKAKEHQQYLANLKKGDRVVTGGGIHGQITGLTDTVVTLEVAENVRIKVTKAAIAGSVADVEKATAPKGG